MKKAKTRQREINFSSQKCQRIICVNDSAEQEYALKLDADEQVMSYEENVSLDRKNFQYINRIGIRTAYFGIDWKTDFLIRKVNGALAVCELVKPGDLDKVTVLEQLELSRRYWEVTGVTDWKIVLIVRGTDVS